MQTAKLWKATRTSLIGTLTNLAVIGILVAVQTMMQDQLFKLSSVQNVQQWPQYETLWNTQQKRLLAG